MGLSPRGRRGTWYRPQIDRYRAGLSPRGRGNLRARCTGARRSEKGLSPRGRGNLERVLPVDVMEGPIPARAGEPASRVLASLSASGLSPRGRGNLAIRRRCRDPPDRAYPRAGGGTAYFRIAAARRAPRAYPRAGGGTCADFDAGRRVRQARAYPRAGGGTTPACPPAGVVRRAYPRAGGGTFVGCNHRAAVPWLGPIPARAGEPPVVPRP